jgi:hypothetical protein
MSNSGFSLAICSCCDPVCDIDIDCYFPSQPQIPAAMFEQPPRDAPRISKSPPTPRPGTGRYWDLVRKVRRYFRVSRPQPRAAHSLKQSTVVLQVARMKWGTVYTLLVVGGAGIMAADLVGRPAASRSKAACVLDCAGLRSGFRCQCRAPRPDHAAPRPRLQST